jgi:hypothetical protein
MNNTKISNALKPKIANLDRTAIHGNKNATSKSKTINKI